MITLLLLGLGIALIGIGFVALPTGIQDCAVLITDANKKINTISGCFFMIYILKLKCATTQGGNS